MKGQSTEGGGKMKYKNAANTNSLIMVFKVRNKEYSEKIIHISHNSRLFKLADFIFHIYKGNLKGSNFEFSYLEEGTRSYGDNYLFRLQPKDSPLPSAVGNVRHARIDSAFFFDTKSMVLRVGDNASEEYVVEFLRNENPKSRRKYPFVEREISKKKEKSIRTIEIKEQNTHEELLRDETKYHSDPNKETYFRSKPRILTLDQVSISRDGEYAKITYLDEYGGGMALKVEGNVDLMSDREILQQHNEVVEAMERISKNYQHVPVEIPVGKPQITFYPQSCQWVPRGDVLRCLISDGGPDYEATVIIDDQELSLKEFGRLLVTHAGWGMRITFVPDNETHIRHLVEISDPKDET